jgi:hypothetical protein
MTTATANSNDLGITFDEFSKIRILPSDQYEASEHLKDECKDFTQSKMASTVMCLSDWLHGVSKHKPT